MTVAVALLFLSLALLVFFADHLAHSIQVDHIMRVVERTTLPVIEPAPNVARRASCRRAAPAIPVAARASGYVQSSPRASAGRGRGAAGQRADAAADRRARRGRHAAGLGLAGGPGAPGSAGATSASLAAAVRIGFERTLEQDPGLGLRQLVDTACKALSPAVNDPYTAIQAVEHLSVLVGDHEIPQVGGVGDHVIRLWRTLRDRQRGVSSLV